MKAQSKFGGTKPKQTGTRVRQVGSFSATPGVNAFKNNAGSFPMQGKDRKDFSIPKGNIVRKTRVKQVGTFSATPGVNAFKNNHQQVHAAGGFGMQGITTKSATSVGRPTGKVRASNSPRKLGQKKG